MASPVWQRTGPVVQSEQVGEHYAVFDPGTGETHFLSELPVLLLSLLDSTPRAELELVGRLTAGHDLDVDLSVPVRTALVSLVRAELIESHDP